MSTKEIQEVLDREKPWFDLARMALTAVGLAIASFVGAKFSITISKSAFDAFVRMLALVGPILFSLFLFYRIIVVVNAIVDIYFPKVRHGERSQFAKLIGYMVLFFVLYSANGLLLLTAAAIAHQ